MTLEELGGSYPEYKPTFEFKGKYIDSAHKYYSRCRLQDGVLIQIRNRRWFGSFIEGWLRREDALKLYEIAYLVKGDILELGSYYGLSTCILSQANHHSHMRKRIYSVDINSYCLQQTEQNLKAKGLQKNVITICSEATSAVRNLIKEGKRFEFVFVDHSHTYQNVYPVCQELNQLVVQGGFCLFHDFNDPRNRISQDEDYGVYQAVIDGISSEIFEFSGIFGCSALFRKREYHPRSGERSPERHP